MSKKLNHQTDGDIVLTTKILSWVLSELSHLEKMIANGYTNNAKEKLKELTLNLDHFLKESK